MNPPMANQEIQRRLARLLGFVGELGLAAVWGLDGFMGSWIGMTLLWGSESSHEIQMVQLTQHQQRRQSRRDGHNDDGERIIAEAKDQR